MKTCVQCPEKKKVNYLVEIEPSKVQCQMKDEMLYGGLKVAPHNEDEVIGVGDYIQDKPQLFGEMLERMEMGKSAPFHELCESDTKRAQLVQISLIENLIFYFFFYLIIGLGWSRMTNTLKSAVQMIPEW